MKILKVIGFLIWTSVLATLLGMLLTNRSFLKLDIDAPLVPVLWIAIIIAYAFYADRKTKGLTKRYERGEITIDEYMTALGHRD